MASTDFDRSLYRDVLSLHLNLFVPRLFKLPARLFFFGVFKPIIKILGLELSGEIEAIDKDVKRFKEGGPVFGSPGIAFGAHAEYICLSEDGILSIKPANTNWEQAASVFLGTHTALYFLRDLRNIQTGQRILINGASGGLGTFAVQLAKYFGAEVTGVCSTTNFGYGKIPGRRQGDRYTKADFTKNGETYDHIFDVVTFNDAGYAYR